jgi:hypothetical protein
MIFNYDKNYAEKYVEIYRIGIVNGEQKIVHQQLRKDDILSDLENIIISDNSRPAKNLMIYSSITGIEQTVRDTNESRTIFKEYLGQNILGMYDPSKDIVYIKSGLDPLITAWVKEHEYAHRRRAHTGETQDEELVDNEASARLGFNPFGNRFYRNAA